MSCVFISPYVSYHMAFLDRSIRYLEFLENIAYLLLISIYLNKIIFNAKNKHQDTRNRKDAARMKP